MKPVRIQRKRTKGWRMPENTRCVTRPGIFGNPFTVAQLRELNYIGTDAELSAACVGAFREWLKGDYRRVWDGARSEWQRNRLLNNLHQLRGKNLACFCALDKPCHADVLLELANPDRE